MNAKEMKIFESDPLFDECCQMRYFDEEAKHPGLKVPDFRHYEDDIIQCITEAPKTAKETLNSCTYIRNGND